MNEPKRITEADAQKLANWTGLFISVDKDGSAFWFNCEPIVNAKTVWSCLQDYFNCGELPIRIDSTRPWTEQIWRPE